MNVSRRCLVGLAASLVTTLLVSSLPIAVMAATVADQRPGVRPIPFESSMTPACDPASDALWWDGFRLPTNNGSTYAAIRYGQDLVVGGDFTQTGNARAIRVARWNGSSWSALGDGVPKDVHALVEWNGHILAGCWGELHGVDEPLVFEFDGSSWNPLGAMVDTTTNHALVFALAVCNGDLIAGGSFTHADGQPVSGIARWNGASWQPLGSGLTDTQSLSRVRALLSYGENLVAGGRFASYHNIARWDGISWSDLGAGFDSLSEVQALATDGPNLYASGAIGGSGGVPLTDLARWNGSAWSSFGDGYGSALTFFDGAVIARIGGVVSRWTGTGWSPVGSGLSCGPSDILAPWGTRLVAAGSELSNGIVAFDGSSWAVIVEPWAPGMAGLSGFVGAATPWEGSLLVAASAAGAQDSFVVVPAVAAWDGAQWAPFGPANGLRTFVYSFSIWRGSLIAAGSFLILPSPRSIAQWNGSSWQTMGGGFRGGGTPYVHDTAVYDDELIAVGSFTRDSTTVTILNRIAAWNGVAWHPLGSGFDSFSDQPYAAIPFGGDLVVTGEFADAGGVPASNIARWDGSSWHALGGGIDGFGYAVEVFEGDLIVGGEFTSAGGNAAAGVARWDGTSWSAMGDGVIEMQAFRVIDGRLYGAGEFECDGEEVTALASWDGGRWNLLGSGFTPGSYVRFIEPWNGDVYVGGDFGWANGKPSFRIARWTGASLLGVSAGGARGDLAPRLWPNPTTGEARVELVLPSPGRLVIEVLDLAGRRVATVQDGVLPAGPHSFRWDGLDDRKRACPAGLYLVRVGSHQGSRTIKCVRAR